MALDPDPTRDEVEASLRRLFDAVPLTPCAVVRAAGRTLSDAIDVARALVGLTLNGVLGWDGDAGLPSLRSAAPTTVDTRTARGDVAEPWPQDRRAGGAAGTEGAAELAIPGYEDLAASHIVARLERLPRDELVQIAAFERGHRGRRTVLGKIDQLLARP